MRTERRAYPRFKVMLSGLCSVAGAADVRCDVIDMSMGGAALRVETSAQVGADVIASLPQDCLLRGRVARAFPGNKSDRLGGGNCQEPTSIVFRFSKCNYKSC